jgi:DNA-binding PadR family transcriptional regulator
MDNSSQELVDELAFSWLEMHKKSALTYLVLVALSSRALWAKGLEAWIAEKSGWSIHERALYRILQRLEKQGVIIYKAEAAERTGADRKVYTITAEGEELLASIKNELQYLKHL